MKTKEESKHTPLDYMAKRSAVNSTADSGYEELFLGVCAKMFPGVDIRRNKKRWMNPSFPLLSATPDLIGWRGAGRPVLVFEVKSTRNSQNGLRKVNTTSGREEFEIRSGHEWHSQLLVHLIVTGTDVGYIACNIEGAWRLAMLRRTEEQVVRLVGNLLGRYFESLSDRYKQCGHLIADVTKAKKGRPRLNKALRYRNNFLMFHTLCLPENAESNSQ